MKKTLLSLSIAAAAVSMPAQAADIGGGLDLSGNLALTTNYMWRGFTQTNNQEAIQGGLDLAHESGLYVGVWGSNVAGGSEFDYYGGFATEVASVGIDLGVIAYRFPDASSGDNEEYYLGLSKEFGGVGLGVTFYEGEASGQADAYEISASTEMAGLGLGATYGDFDNSGDYYTLGVSKEFLSEKWPVEVSLTYVDYDADAASGRTDSEDLVLTVSKSF
jgi:uncharacterized protein (TIGR02001 family)